MFQQVIDLKGKDSIKIVPISDMHIGLKETRMDIFEDILDELKEPNTYWIGLGDYVEGRAPNHKFWNYDDNTLPVQEQYDTFFNMIKPYKDKCLGLHVGNHEFGLIRDTTIDPLKSYSLENGIPYLGGTAMTVFKRGNKTFKLCTLHGAGGGCKVGSNVNKLTDYLKSFSADAIMCGHFHRLAVSIDVIPYVDEMLKQRWRNAYVILTGSALNGYETGVTSYAERGMYSPNCLGYATITLDKDLKADVRLHPYV